MKILGKKELKRQLELADVNHCLLIEEVVDELIEEFYINKGDFDSSVYYSSKEYLKISYQEGKLLS